MVAKSTKQIEVENNAKIFFEKLKKNEFDNQIGLYALMKGGKVIQFFETKDDARKAGYMQYNDGLFSIQKVEKDQADLGFYSYAVH